ncbi:hypothetical protein [Actinotalea sp. Marseille-Q4924]|uniref:hypothetical protein n=1 Tax=Actinotalea sp. Marseille-Q4924 TaxID=2866571 RepID=UPI001CE3C66F|nr:hypothetical protein [Actinotalea sp. Marseille-Q4924]
MSTRELVIRLLVVWGVGAGAGSLLLFLAGVVVLLLALAPVGTTPVLAVWAAYLLLTSTALVGAVAAAVTLWESGPTARRTSGPHGLARTHHGAHVPHGLVAVPGAAVAVLVARPVLSPGVVLEIPVLVEALAGAALAVAVVPAVVATVTWARARRRGPAAPPSLA